MSLEKIEQLYEGDYRYPRCQKCTNGTGYQKIQNGSLLSYLGKFEKHGMTKSLWICHKCDAFYFGDSWEFESALSSVGISRSDYDSKPLQQHKVVEALFLALTSGSANHLAGEIANKIKVGMNPITNSLLTQEMDLWNLRNDFTNFLEKRRSDPNAELRESVMSFSF